MDISRLPAAPLVPTGEPTANRSVRRVAMPLAVRADESPQVPPVTRRPSGSVIQGELLYRDRGGYQSTRAFLNERALGQAHPVVPAATHRGASPDLISRYQQHARVESLAETVRGQSVNLVV